MTKTMKISVVLAAWLAAPVGWVPVAGAESAPLTGRSLTDSPYKDGPPAASGGYTDTSQGGTKTSGDMPVLPPSAGGNAAVKGGQQQKGQPASQPGAPQGEKPAGGRSPG